MWRKGNSFALLVGMQTSAITVESNMEIHQKVKNGPAFWPSSLTSANIFKGMQNTNLKEHKHPYVRCSVIYNHQDMEAAQVSISRWVDETIMRHLHNGILFGHKKFLLSVTVWMDLENIMLSEISQRKTNIMWSHSYVESNEQTELTNKMERDSHRAGWQLRQVEFRG